VLTERNRQIKKAETNRKGNGTFERGELVGEVLDGGFRHSWRAKSLCKYLKKEAADKKKPEAQQTNLGICCELRKAPGAPTEAPQRDASGCPGCPVQMKMLR
jgi:hypothetical protein